MVSSATTAGLASVLPNCSAEMAASARTPGSASSSRSLSSSGKAGKYCSSPSARAAAARTGALLSAEQRDELGTDSGHAELGPRQRLGKSHATGHREGFRARNGGDEAIDLGAQTLDVVADARRPSCRSSAGSAIRSNS